MVFRLLPMTFFCVLAFASAVKAESHYWHFDPSKGLDGRAHVTNAQGQRLEVECGNGGGSAFTLSPALEDSRAAAGEGPLLLFQFDIDGALYDQSFRCPAGLNACYSAAMPSRCLMDALESGQRLQLIFNEITAAQFSLTGSKATLGRLNTCKWPH